MTLPYQGWEFGSPRLLAEALLSGKLFFMVDHSDLDFEQERKSEIHTQVDSERDFSINCKSVQLLNILPLSNSLS